MAFLAIELPLRQSMLMLKFVTLRVPCVRVLATLARLGMDAALGLSEIPHETAAFPVILPLVLAFRLKIRFLLVLPVLLEVPFPRLMSVSVVLVRLPARLISPGILIPLEGPGFPETIRPIPAFPVPPAPLPGARLVIPFLLILLPQSRLTALILRLVLPTSLMVARRLPFSMLGMAIRLLLKSFAVKVIMTLTMVMVVIMVVTTPPPPDPGPLILQELAEFEIESWVAPRLSMFEMGCITVCARLESL